MFSKVRDHRDQVRYISLHDFRIKTNKATDEWEAQLTENTGMVIYHSGSYGKSTPLYLGIKEKPTTVYLWLAEYDG